MAISQDDSDDALLQEIGARIARYRLNQDKSQALLAQESGVSQRTLSRVEHGQSVQFSSLLRILRALQLLGNLEALIPPAAVSPMQQMKAKGKRRQRASALSHREQGAWSWGDE